MLLNYGDLKADTVAVCIRFSFKINHTNILEVQLCFGLTHIHCQLFTALCPKTKVQKG